MYFFKIKNISIALCLMLLPASVLAAGLGQLNIASGIGEPLKANIELLSVTPAELASLKASIAPESTYEAQGIERTAVHQDIKVTVGKGVNGLNVLQLRTVQPMTEPYLDMIVALEWSNGRILRTYTALLDPPEYQPESSSRLSATDTDNKTSGQPNPTQQAKKPAVNSTKSTPAQEHLTRRGDTLYKIARRMQPAGVNLDEVLVAIFEANPDAFDGKNMNRLKVGKILQAPTEAALDAMTRQKATQEIRLQTADWNKYRNKLASAVAKRKAQATGEDTQATSGKIKSAAEDQSAPKGNEPQDVVKLSTGDVDAQDASMQAKITALQEEISAREKGLKEAESRTAALEKQIQDMQKLLALKNNTMLDAQEQSTQKEVVEIAPDSVENVEAEANEKVAELNENQPAAEPMEVTPEPEKASAPVEEKRASFLASLQQSVLGVIKNVDKMILGVVAALLGLLFLGWLYFRNKDSKKLEDFEQGIMTSGSLKANTVFGDTATGSTKAGDTSFLTDFSQSTGNGLIDTNDVDPIAEAEVYMAYGRDAQAEEILKDAILKEPQRYELHLKLLEMYAANKNISAFEALASEMHTSLDAEDSTWIQVAATGAKLDPNNALYQTKKSDDVATSTVVAEAITNERAEEGADVRVETSVDGALDASDFTDSPLAAEADLDFSEEDENEIANVAGVGDSASNNDLDIDTSFLDVPNVEAVLETKEADLQFDMGESSTEEVTPPVAEPNEVTDGAPSVDFPEIEISSSEIADEVDAIEHSNASEFTLDMPNLDVSTPPEDAQSNADDLAEDFAFGGDEQAESNNTQAGVIDISNISLDIDDNQELSTDEEPKVEVGEELLMPANEEVETKLELVAAYIDMEDKDGAKELLEEVLKEGNFSQRKRADEMLATLA